MKRRQFLQQLGVASLGAYLFVFGLLLGLISPFVIIAPLAFYPGGGTPAWQNTGFNCFGVSGLLLLSSYILGFVARRTGSPSPRYLIWALVGAFVFSIPWFLHVLP